jgi:hypothetical protein
MIIGCRLVSRKYHIGPFKHRLNKKSCPCKALAKSAMAYCDSLRLCHCFVANGATQAPTFMNCSHEKLPLIQQSNADALSQQTFCRPRNNCTPYQIPCWRSSLRQSGFSHPFDVPGDIVCPTAGGEGCNSGKTQGGIEMTDARHVLFCVRHLSRKSMASRSDPQ